MRIPFTVLLFEHANFQASQVRAKGVTDQRGSILLSTACRTVGSLQEFSIEDYLYRLHTVDSDQQCNPQFIGVSTVRRMCAAAIVFVCWGVYVFSDFLPRAAAVLISSAAAIAVAVVSRELARDAVYCLSWLRVVPRRYAPAEWESGLAH